MTVKHAVDLTVQAPASLLWMYVKAYGRIHEYVDFIDSTTMEEGVEPTVGVLRVVHTTGNKHLNETITAWDEENKTYTYDVKNGPPFAETVFVTITVEEVDATTSKLMCAMDVELTTIFSWILPTFLLKKKLGGKMMGIAQGYQNAAEKKLPV
jgi:hypothetical protein